MKEKQGASQAQLWLLPEFSVMSRRCGYIYINNFKAGCSTIRRSLWKAEYQLGFVTTLPGDPHDANLAPFDHNAHARWEACEGNFVFTFVRNPYSRLLSAYLDKIANVHEPNVWPSFSAKHGLGERRPSFSEFVELLATENDLTIMNPHWRPQSLALGYGVVPFDFIGTLENFGPDLKQVMLRIFGKEVPVEEFAPHRTGAADQVASFITAKEQKLIMRLYEADFANFGYSTSLRTLSTTGFVIQRGLREPMRVWGRSERLYAEGDYVGAYQAIEELTRWGEWPHLARRRAICLREVGKAKRKRGIKELRRTGRRGWGNRGDAGVLPLLSDLLAPSRRPTAGGEEQGIDLGIAELRRAAQLLPTDMTVHKHLGLSLLAAGDLEDGIEALIRAVSFRDPTAAGTQKRLRHYHRRLAVLRARRRGRKAGLEVLGAREAGPVTLTDRLLVGAASLAGRALGARGQDPAGSGHQHRAPGRGVAVPTD